MGVVAGEPAGRRGGEQGDDDLVGRGPLIRVVVGECDPLAAQAVTALLSAAADVAVIGCVSGASELTRAVETVSPSVLVVDVGQQPFSAEGLLAQLITAGGHVVVLTTGLTPADAVELLRAGVRGVIDKADISLLDVAVRAAAAGQVLVAPAVSTPMVDHWRAMRAPPVATPVLAALSVASESVPSGGQLTSREHATLVLIAAGHNSDEAARQLGVSAATLQGRMHRVIRKLKVKDRTQAVAWAYLSGLCSVPAHPTIT